MAIKPKSSNQIRKLGGVRKRTSIGRGNIKKSSMNKNKKRSYKKYRGQG